MDLQCWVGQILWVEEFAELLPFFLVSEVGQHLELGTEFLKFILPVVQCCDRNDYEEGSPNVFRLCNVCHQRNGLDCLSESHLVSQNSIDSLLIKVIEPPQTTKLVLF